MKRWSTAVFKNRYFDSVFLMTVAQRLSEVPDIETAAAVMATAANKMTLARMGFDAATFENATANDLLVALSGDERAVARLLADPGQWLVRSNSSLEGALAPSLDDAWRRQPRSNIAVISLPGEYAAAEAHAALDRGLNVFLFSDHVSLEDEVALKQRASEEGLIVMGPDCGTALVAGTGIGFANVVRRGPIGVVASSGTGLQEFTSLVHRAGGGISHGFGTGSRDLSDSVGARSTLAAVDALEQDPGTRVIAIISKPPGQATLRRITERLSRCSKPVVGCFLGLRTGGLPDNSPGVEIGVTLDDAVIAALRLTQDQASGVATLTSRQRARLVAQETTSMRPDQVYVRGLFAGGTFCYQAQQVMRDGDFVTYSNAPLDGGKKLAEASVSVENSLVDMGADEFTAGVPHPMIDSRKRRERILAEAADLHVAVLLLDFILGYNAAPDPAGDLAPAIEAAKARVKKTGGYLSVVSSVCGTDEDVQGLKRQEEVLRGTGSVVFPSSAQASLFARDILNQRMGCDRL